MIKKTLHITNGDSLNNWLTQLQIEGDFAVWREILCEGQTVYNLDDQNFIDARKSFLKADHGLGTNDYENKFISQLQIIKNHNDYDEIILWFEYDLFCHINMVACISYLSQLQCTTAIYLVCSGKIVGETLLKGLAELSETQLRDHYKAKVKLTASDIQLADRIWKLYCDNDHTLFQSDLANNSSFIYLQSCIKAHIERFPDNQSGLNRLETQVLKTIKEQSIDSKHQLCGLILKNQGYYGFGDLQIAKIIERLHPYYESKENQIVVSELGEQVLSGTSKKNTNQEETYFGGTLKRNYVYHKDSQKITKA